MIVRTDDLKLTCSKILFAVDTSDLSVISETLQLKTLDNYLYLSVANKEYYVEVKLDIYENEDFNATVNANVFLKLIASITTESIEFIINGNSLEIIGNGKYKLPLIYNNDSLLELPRIHINNVTKSFNISSDILNSILLYNSKELNKGVIVRNQAQRMYYIDEKGAITFTSGACVNYFNLDDSIKMLLPSKIVKLFKLFKSGDVKFSIGYDPLENSDIIQTKVCFEDSTISITAIIACDESLISSVPAEAIRKKASDGYKYSVILNKNDLLNALNRLLIFTDNSSKTAGIFEFTEYELCIKNTSGDSSESLYYLNGDISIENNLYKTCLRLLDLKLSLESYKGDSIALNFGCDDAISISYENICSIIPKSEF